MPISTAPASKLPPSRQHGFTLVEMMIVVALMGLLTAAVILSVGHTGAGAADTATTFASRLAAARDEAILAGSPIGAWVTPSGYGFDRFSDGHWEVMSDKPFDGANWGEGTAVAVASAKDSRGRVRFDSLGMPDRPFAVAVNRNGHSATVRVSANGDIGVK